MRILLITLHSRIKSGTALKCKYDRIGESMNTNKSHILKWRFDISTFRLIGRDLITDRVTALFELVKNCYDANAQNVDIIFEKFLYNDLRVKHTRHYYIQD